MKNITLSLIVFFVASIVGCVTSSKTIKPSIETQSPLPLIEEKEFSEAPISVSEQPIGIQTYPNVVAATTEPPIPQIEIKQESARISYSQITNLISEFIDIKEHLDVSGQNSFFGISENKLTIMEVTGDKDNIKEASIKLIYPKGIDKTSAELNNAMMSRFLKNAAPEFTDWQGRVSGIFNKFNSIDGTSQEDIIINNKLIQILYDKNANYIVVTLKPKQ